MNILFTCAGRRNYLINYFKQAIGEFGKTIAVDYQLSAPALVEADIAVQVPKIYDEDYISVLKNIISNHKVNALISLNDLELPILAKNKSDIEKLGAKVIISSNNVIDICFDKWKTYNFLTKNLIDTPKTYIGLNSALKAINSNEVEFPLIVKPRWGSASISVETAHDINELNLIYELQNIKLKKTILANASLQDKDHSIIIQEKIGGWEFGMDILNDFDGNHYGSFVRKKLAMRSGETDKAISVIDDKFQKLGEKLGKTLKHIGNLDCDFFMTKEGNVYLLEMNPRFGGGYPFSHEAGIQTSHIYISWLKKNNDIDEYNNYKDGVMFSKCDRMVPIFISK